jgi:hypothetical protein
VICALVLNAHLTEQFTQVNYLLICDEDVKEVTRRVSRSAPRSWRRREAAGHHLRVVPRLTRNHNGPTTVHCFMMMILRTAVCVAAIMCVADTAPAIAKKARLVCEYGRCWQNGAGYDYQYAYRPPTKWEQKGFCPPGQAKKGNC